MGGGAVLAPFYQKKFPKKLIFLRGVRFKMGVGVIFPYSHFSIDIFYEAFPWWLFDMYFYFFRVVYKICRGWVEETPSCWCQPTWARGQIKYVVMIQFIFNLSSQYILLSLHLPIISCVWFVYINLIYWCVKCVICISQSLVA